MRVNNKTFRWYRCGKQYFLEHTYNAFDVAKVWYSSEVRGWVGEVFGEELEVEHSTLKKIKLEVEQYLDVFVTHYRIYRGRKV